MRLLGISHRAWSVMFTKLLHWITHPPTKKNHRSCVCECDRGFFTYMRHDCTNLVHAKYIAPLISVLALVHADLSSSIFFLVSCVCVQFFSMPRHQTSLKWTRQELSWKVVKHFGSLTRAPEYFPESVWSRRFWRIWVEACYLGLALLALLRQHNLFWRMTQPPQLPTPPRIVSFPAEVGYPPHQRDPKRAPDVQRGDIAT